MIKQLQYWAVIILSLKTSYFINSYSIYVINSMFTVLKANEPNYFNFIKKAAMINFDKLVNIQPTSSYVRDHLIGKLSSTQ